MARYYQNTPQIYQSQVVPLPLELMKSYNVGQQTKYDASVEAQAKADALLNEVATAYNEDEQTKQRLIGELKNKFNSIYDKHHGDLASASPEIISTIGQMKSSPFWKSNEAAVKAAEESQKLANTLGGKAINFWKAPSATYIDKETGEERYRSASDIRYQVEERYDREKKMREMFTGIQPTESIYGLSGTGRAGLLKYGTISEITDPRVKEIAREKVQLYKETNEGDQHLRELALKNGLYSKFNMSGIEAEQALIDKKAEEFGGDKAKAKQWLDDAIISDIHAANTQLEHRRQDMKIVQDPSFERAQRTTTTPTTPRNVYTPVDSKSKEYTPEAIKKTQDEVKKSSAAFDFASNYGGFIRGSYAKYFKSGKDIFPEDANALSEYANNFGNEQDKKDADLLLKAAEDWSTIDKAAAKSAYQRLLFKAHEYQDAFTSGQNNTGYTHGNKEAYEKGQEARMIFGYAKKLGMSGKNPGDFNAVMSTKKDITFPSLTAVNLNLKDQNIGEVVNKVEVGSALPDNVNGVRLDFMNGNKGTIEFTKSDGTQARSVPVDKVVDKGAREVIIGTRDIADYIKNMDNLVSNHNSKDAKIFKFANTGIQYRLDVVDNPYTDVENDRTWQLTPMINGSQVADEITGTEAILNYVSQNACDLFTYGTHKNTVEKVLSGNL